jgi:hypothetical protein
VRSGPAIARIDLADTEADQLDELVQPSATARRLGRGPLHLAASAST